MQIGYYYLPQFIAQNQTADVEHKKFLKRRRQIFQHSK